MWGISADLGLPTSIPNYIVNGDTTADINSLPKQGWFFLNAHPCTTLFHIALAATGAPVGQFIFEVTSDANPLVTPILTPVILNTTDYLGAPLKQPWDGLARIFTINFDSVPLVPWMRMRYARTSGGSAAAGAFMVAVNHT
jgi:hypothetical protein